MSEIVIYDAGVTPRGKRFIVIRVILENRGARSRLSWAIADAIEQELSRLRKRRGAYYDFLVDAFSPRQVGVECPPDPYTKKRVIRAVSAVAKSHRIEVRTTAYP